MEYPSGSVDCLLILFKGAKYNGEWKNDKATGNGIFIYSNGDKYEGKLYFILSSEKGEWLNGEKHGQGTYYFHDRGKYVGEW